MKTMQDRYQSWMNAITFAEAGEWDTAREMMPTDRPVTTPGWLEQMFMSVAFAEAGMHEEAVRYAVEAEKEQQKKCAKVSGPVRQFTGWLERMGMAIAYAEEGMADEAVNIIEPKKIGAKPFENFLDAVGLHHVRVSYGVIKLGSVRVA